MPSQERAPYERETLVFDNPEDAGVFKERIKERETQEKTPGVKRRREIIGEELAAEFEKQGESVGNLNQPWEHTEQEHTDVQELVNVVFAKDLKAGLAKARSSSHYPRNLDLLHDVLTTEMYDLTRDHSVNKQSLGVPLLTVVIIALVIAVGIFLLLALSL